MQQSVTRFFDRLGEQSPREVFDFLYNPLLWVFLLVVLPLTIVGLGALVYFGASLYNYLERRLFRKPGEIVLGRKAQTFSDWLFHRPITIRLPDALSGSEVNGPPRQGKTEFLAGQGYQYLRAGVTVFILELSGDLGSRLIPYARAMGKPVYLFDASRPRASMKWSPLSGIPEKVAEQAVTTFMSISNTKEEFFRIFNAVELRHIVHAVCAHAARVGRVPWLHDCIHFLVDEKYQKEVLDLGRVNSPNGKDSEITVRASNLSEHSRIFFQERFLKQWTDRERNQFTEGLYDQLDNLLALEVVRYLLSPEPDEDYLDLRHALSSGGLIVFRMPQAELGDAVSRTLATWSLQHFQQETLARGESANPIIALLDELHRTLGHKNPEASDSFASWTADIPKNRVGAFECYQSRAQLSPELRDTIATTSRQKYVLGGLDPIDAEQAEATLGFADTRVTDRRHQESGMMPDPARRPDTVGEREEHQPRVRAEQIRETPRGYAWARLAVRGRLREPMLLKTYRPPPVDDVAREFGYDPYPDRHPEHHDSPTDGRYNGDDGQKRSGSSDLRRAMIGHEEKTTEHTKRDG